VANLTRTQSPPPPPRTPLTSSSSRLSSHSGEEAKKLIFSPFKPDDKHIIQSRRAEARRKRLANERKPKNHLNRNRQALKEQQQNNRKSIREKLEKESMALQQREKKKNELYGGVKSRVFDKSYADSRSTAGFEISSPSLSLHNSYGKVPRYISNRKAKIESEMWGC
jgi:exonuclease VII large subunit